MICTRCRGRIAPLRPGTVWWMNFRNLNRVGISPKFCSILEETSKYAVRLHQHNLPKILLITAKMNSVCTSCVKPLAPKRALLLNMAGCDGWIVSSWIGLGYLQMCRELSPPPSPRIPTHKSDFGVLDGEEPSIMKWKFHQEYFQWHWKLDILSFHFLMTQFLGVTLCSAQLPAHTV